MGALDEIRKRKAELTAQIEREGRAALQAAFRTFFDAHPTIQAVRWRQYTPYFNDGEPCTFGLGELTYRVAGQTEDDGGDYEDGFYSRYSLGSRWDRSRRESVVTDQSAYDLRDACKDFEKEVTDEDVFLAVFGDHVMVTATREGFEVESYEHE